MAKGKNASSNPADAYNRQQKKKEREKIRKTREENRETTFIQNNPAAVRRTIAELESQPSLSKSQKQKLSNLRTLYVKAHGPLPTKREQESKPQARPPPPPPHNIQPFSPHPYQFQPQQSFYPFQVPPAPVQPFHPHPAMHALPPAPVPLQALGQGPSNLPGSSFGIPPHTGWFPCHIFPPPPPPESPEPASDAEEMLLDEQFEVDDADRPAQQQEEEPTASALPGMDMYSDEEESEESDEDSEEQRRLDEIIQQRVLALKSQTAPQSLPPALQIPPHLFRDAPPPNDGEGEKRMKVEETVISSSGFKAAERVTMFVPRQVKKKTEQQKQDDLDAFLTTLDSS
ncbi:hypothetical protein BLNAU_11312 [Blattamonas nauphoetae]|uniref:Wbp11/ELF5/Saf1 N-terminal domain-containing protein n=1 Tax=Blattamonas nauphoetae TaxID=2049346 RepID=A0ABQ9XSP8_9EUKA|nr:hypothetical protein BLNAU_11312 [Blattamonas nauphoetae]